MMKNLQYALDELDYLDPFHSGFGIGNGYGTKVTFIAFVGNSW